MESHLPDDDTVPHSQVAQDFRSTAASAAEAVLHPPTLRAVLMLDDSEGMRKSPICLVRFGAHERGSPRSCMGVVRGVVLLI